MKRNKIGRGIFNLKLKGSVIRLKLNQVHIESLSDKKLKKIITCKEDGKLSLFKKYFFQISKY
ncbi:MAG: hypothetical protein ACTSO2_20210 [Promethearchaeota archaeon]